MTHNLRKLGIALTLATAIGAMAAAPAAMAVTHTFHTSEGQKAFLAAEALGTYTIKATPEDDSEIKCNKYTTNSSFTDGAQLITIAPTFSECSYRIGKMEGSASIEMTGCDFLVTAKTEAGNVTGGEHAPAHIQCPGEVKHLDTRITALKLLCRTVPAQTSMGLRFVNSATEGGLKDIIVESTIHDGISTTPNTTACPTESGKPEVHNTGTVVGSIRIRGFKDEAKTMPTGIWFE